MLNTDAESVDDMVAASSSDVVKGRVILSHSNPDIQEIKSPAKSVVSTTPRVD